MKHLTYTFALFILLCLAYGIGRGCAEAQVERDTVTRVDIRHIAHYETIYQEKAVFVNPLPLLSKVTDTIVVHDTVLLRESKVYEDSCYTAWVSGIDPSLDSIEVRNKVVQMVDTFAVYTDRIITVGRKSKRVSVGLNSGYGIGRNGLTPYVGIGVSYRIFAF